MVLGDTVIGRKVLYLWEMFVPDYWDMDPVHVAHRSLVKEQKAKEEEEEEEEALPPLVQKRLSCDSLESGIYCGSVASIEGETMEEKEVRYKSQNSWIVQLFLIMDEPNWDLASHCYAIFMSSVIIISSFTYMLGTLKNFKTYPETCANPICVPGPDTPCTHQICFPKPSNTLYIVEFFSMILFTVDYLVRVATVHAVPLRLIYPQDYVHGYLPKEEPPPLRKTFSYMCQFMNIVDIATVLPFYLHFVLDDLNINLVFLRLVRLLRVVRIFKLGRYSEGHEIIFETLMASIPALIIMLFYFLVITIMFGALIFYAEEGSFMVTEEFPDGAYLRKSLGGEGFEVSPFRNILMGCYWVIMTATSVGYGDVFPTTPVGRCIAVVVAYSGIVTVALPVTIIGKHFNDIYFMYREADKKKADELEAARMAQEAEIEALTHTHTHTQLGEKTVGRVYTLPVEGKDEKSVCVSVVGGGKRLSNKSHTHAHTPSSLTVSLPESLMLVAEDPALAQAAATWSNSSSGSVGSGGVGGSEVRKRALTSMIREQLVRMDNTTKFLMDRLEELENV